MHENPVKRLPDFGQSPWLDFIERKLLATGELERMIEQRGLRGMTSNPAIFDKALAESDDYTADIRRLAGQGRTREQVYEALVLDDVGAAADRFAPVYRQTEGLDGYVSIEVSPHLARDTAGTIDEARRLWSALERANVMIKVPGTAEGLEAIRTLLAEGINVNVTLLFSVERYRAVLESHMAGLEAAVRAGRPISGVASVASFFLSRIDTAVDARLDEIADEAGPRAREAAAVRGEAAVACARQAYGVLENALSSQRFAQLADRGARVQRLLWASTGTKDPAYGPTKYVEPLIGPHTVNTMPLATFEAYEAEGRPAPTLPGDRDRAREVLETLARLDIDLDRVASGLVEEGIEKFVRPYDASLARIEPFC